MAKKLNQNRTSTHRENSKYFIHIQNSLKNFQDVILKNNSFRNTEESLNPK